MKRVISGLVAVFVLLCSVSFAEIPDLTGLSVEELLKTREEIERLLYEEGKTIELNAGEYLVGRDISAGTYIIMEYHNPESDNSSEWGITLYKDDESRAEYSKAYEEYLAAYETARKNESLGNSFEYPAEVSTLEYFKRFNIKDEDSIRITIENGQVLYVKCVFDYDPSSRLAITKTTPLFIE